MASIALWSHTVTDPQPSKTHFDKTDQTKPIPGSNYHVQSMLLMTINTVVKIVLHYTEVLHIPHES
jgi:hypothetical protein